MNIIQHVIALWRYRRFVNKLKQFTEPRADFLKSAKKAILNSETNAYTLDILSRDEKEPVSLERQ